MSENRMTFEGEDLTVHWDKNTCAHSAKCVKNLRRVFQPGTRPPAYAISSPSSIEVSGPGFGRHVDLLLFSNSASTCLGLPMCPSKALSYEKKG